MLLSKERIQAQASALQVGFKRELIKEVKLFVSDAQAFRQDWEANGPMAPGLDPMDAVDRLKKFQQMFEVSFACLSGPACRCTVMPCSEFDIDVRQMSTTPYTACCCREVVCCKIQGLQQQLRAAV